MHSGHKTALKEAAVMLIAAAAVGFIANLANPRGYLPVGRSSLEKKPIVYISSEEAKIKYDAASALFVDARADAPALRIRGALAIPAGPESLSLAKIREHFPLLKGGRELVIYCGGSSCGDSETLAMRLAGLGYRRHLYILEKGFPSWVDAKYPVEGGSDTDR